MQNTTERRDVYSRITAQIVEYLEKGVRPWIRPWNAEHATGSGRLATSCEAGTPPRSYSLELRRHETRPHAEKWK